MPDNFSIGSNNDLFTIREVTGLTTPAQDIIRNVWNAQNIGDGIGLFSGKTGHNLLFKSLKAGNNISLSSTSTGVTISSTGGGTGTITGATNGLTQVGSEIHLGGTVEDFTYVNINQGIELEFKSD